LKIFLVARSLAMP